MDARLAAEEHRFAAELRGQGNPGVWIHGRFTADDLDAILRLVRETNSLPVVSIVQRGDEVEVDTGWQGSGGDAFFLHKVDAKWKIVRTMLWEA